MTRAGFWAGRAARVVMALAAVKLAVAAASLAVAVGDGTLQPGVVSPSVVALIAVTYASVGAALTLGGFADARCRSLGLFLLITATAFSDALGLRAHPLVGATPVAVAIRLDVLLPAILWWFVSEFPSRVHTGWAARWPKRVAVASLVIGAGLACVNAFADVSAASGSTVTWMERLSRDHRGDGLFWPALFALMVPAAPAFALRAYHATAVDRRQVRLFALAILGGLLPLAVDVAMRAVSPRWRELIAVPAFAVLVQTAVVVAFLTVPFTTAYAVLVARVADLRLILRAALQYALAKYTVVIVVLLPLAWLAQFIYTHRLLTIEQLGSSRATLALAGGVAAAIAALGLRQRALDHLDRRFFREQYDTERVLQSVMTATRTDASSEHLADKLAGEVDGALHVEHITVLLLNVAAGQFVARDGRVRPLAASSTIVRLLSASDDPLDVDPENPQSVLRRLDTSEVHWLIDGEFRLLVPMRGADGATRGVLALGTKKSELPYSAADRRLLAAMGVSGGLSLARQRTSSAATTDGEDRRGPANADADARECLDCGRVHPPDAARCSCHGALVPAPVPSVLAGKFKLERRLGAGGMGVVYRALDLTLGRTVAIKTLPVSGPAETWRLRREARAMALVSHEHLALIYGAETWHGHPFLIVEYLAGGTLADRLRRERLPVTEAIALGVELCEVLERLHSAGLLHRDLKPSNVGYTASGSSKLLDFGLAQLVAPDSADTGRSGSYSGTTRPDPLNRRTHHGFGTPAYMSPEALACATPTPAFDLWSLAVLMVEAISGVNPFAGKTALETMQRISAHTASDVPAMLSDCPDVLIALLREALHPEPAGRPVSASAFGARLRILSGL